MISIGKKMKTAVATAALCLSVSSCFAGTTETGALVFVRGDENAALSAAESAGGRISRSYPELSKALGGTLFFMRGAQQETLRSAALSAKEVRGTEIFWEPEVVSHVQGFPSSEKTDPRKTAASPDSARDKSVPALDDPFFESGALWGLDALSATDAWNTTTGTKGVYVAVLDSGIDFNHRDLKNNIGTDLDGKRGKNCFDDTPDALPVDEGRHGTHVSGTIGATANNGFAIVGVNWNVSILPVKVLGGASNSGTQETIVAGLDYVLGQKNRGLNIRAVNMSLTGWYSKSTEEETSPYAMAMRAVSDAGIVIVAAAGNEHQNVDAPGGPGSDPKNPTTDYSGKKPWPAAMKTVKNLVSVAASTEAGVPAGFSNYGENNIDVFAPGEDIYSTVPGDDVEPWWGTSMAAPHVTGLVALLAANTPTMGAGAIKNAILSTVKLSPAFKGRTRFAGLPSATDALAVKSAGNDPVSGIVMGKRETTIAVGGEEQLQATILPSTARNLSVSWASRNPEVATVENGVVKGVAEGKTVVEATTSEGGFTASCSVTVSGYAPPPPDPWDGVSGGCSATGGTPFLLLLAAPLLFAFSRKNG